jgi:hypothetical protein
MTAERRYLGSWTLPSGNSVDAFLVLGRLACEWDTQPSASWPRVDVEHWRGVTFPAIVRAIASVTGQRVLGVSA